MADLPSAAAVLRGHDRDRFQTALFADPRSRDALIALHAFDCEVARIRHVVSQPMAGLIRLQWWRDTLRAIADDRPPGQPVARAMHAVWPRLGPHRAALEISIDAREVELEPAPFADLAQLEGHLVATAGVIGRTAARLLGADHAADAADRVFRAWAIVGLLSDIEADRRQGRTMLPVGLLREQGLEPERIAARGDDRALREPVRSAAELAEGLVAEARRELRRPGAALPALLLATPASDALRRLARNDYDHRSAWRRRSPFAPLRLLRRHARGRF